SASGPDRPSGPPECAPARTAAAASSSSSPCLLLIDNDAELATLSSSAEEWGLWSGYVRRVERVANRVLMQQRVAAVHLLHQATLRERAVHREAVVVVVVLVAEHGPDAVGIARA